jgi:hypothetical protein
MIISERHTETVEELRLEFVDLDGAPRVQIPCSPTGDVSPEYWVTYDRACQATGRGELVEVGVKKFVATWTVPAVFGCECGLKVNLVSNYNRCKCGRLYGPQGQQLPTGEGGF